jgi:hypothetical protein
MSGMHPRTMSLLALAALALAYTPGAGAATPESCPITIPPQPGFVPPSPYPAEPPPLYNSVWYGTADLWTMLDPDGRVWRPQSDGPLFDKAFWWSESFQWRNKLQPAITVSIRRIDGSERFEMPGPSTHGFRSDTVQFMLQGVSFPGPGCWEISATYKGAELSFVALVARASNP